MKQLFIITSRWLMRDKKRTALTLASIVLSVFLITFVGVYISTLVNALHGYTAYESPEHVTISPETVENAKVLDNNAAWESHCLTISDNDLMLTKFFGKYGSSGSKVFPVVTVNGKSAFEENTNMAMAVSGDVEELMPRSEFILDGDAPSKPHEVVLSRGAANNFDVKTGDTITIHYEVRTGDFYYAETDENEKIKTDNNGNVIYKKDKYGSKIKEIYNTAALYEENNYGPKSGFDGYYKLFGQIYDKDRNITRNSYFNGVTLPPCYAELSDEVLESADYTATVTGIVDSGYYGVTADFVFYAYDEDIKDIMVLNEPQYFVRVKKDIDAEQAAIDAAKSIGLYDPNHDPHYKLNTELLLYEGRQLEYIEGLTGVILIGVIVMGLFMFLARLIINNAFEISAAHRTEQYGALKTIGASDRQIFTMIMLECAIYMAAALPTGMGLAILLGKAILSHIRSIGVFDPIFGEGVSETFFTMELSPAVMWLSFGCALFSVFFSAYADAMRVRRLPPIQSVGYSTSKQRIKKKSRWMSRRLFGYPFGFAVKCISKQKVRFAVTLLAAVISGVFVMSLLCFASQYAKNELERAKYEDCSVDFIVWTDGTETRKAVAGKLGKMMSTGLFDNVFQLQTLFIPDHSGTMTPYFSDEFRSYSNEFGYFNGLQVSSITRSQYEKLIKSNITYDDLLNSGRILLCNNVYHTEYDGINSETRDIIQKKYGIRRTYTADQIFLDQLEIDVYGTEDIKELSFTWLTVNEPVTDSLSVAGFYKTDEPDFMSSGETYLEAIMPIEIFSGDILESNRLSDIGFNSGNNDGYKFYAKKGVENRARSYIKTAFKLTDNDEEFVDHTMEQKLKDNIIRAVKTAGLGLGGVLAAVVLLNIFSTMSANMINRRRDFSMMRSCGMSLKQVLQSLIIESMFYSVITVVISSISGWIISEMLSSIYIGIAPRLSDLKSFPWLAAVILFIVINAVMAAAYLPSVSAMKKQQIAEEIKLNM